MQAVVVSKYSDANVEYLLTNRTVDKHLTREAADWIRDEINSMESLRFSNEELEFLATAVPFLPASYLSYLKTFKLDPRSQVNVEYTNDLTITVKGPWRDTILYEIPILAIVSEAYFKFVDTNWNYQGQVELAKFKAKALDESGCRFSEFGTRRRRSLKAQQLAIEGILEAAKESAAANFIGTSNVFFAKKYDLRPVGTVAHELMMGIAAYHDDFKNANLIAMNDWLETVGKENAGFALTDTFGTPNFLQVFTKPYTDYYAGVRQDSGDPVEYTRMVSKHYKSLGYAHNEKQILYSDSLNLELCVRYKQAAESVGLRPSFGVGTFFTNDFKTANGDESKPLNIVMKLRTLDGKQCVKLSDNVGKNMGDADAVQTAKQHVGYHNSVETIDEAKRW